MEIDFFRLFISVFICQLAGFVTGILHSKSIEGWYIKLKKPRITPPDWVLSPIWASLYLMQGIALFLIWSSGQDSDISFTLIMFFFQIMLSMAWSFLFFGKKSLFLSLGDIVFLLFAVIITMLSAYNVSIVAAMLFVPYLAWIIFITILNFSIWVLNYTDK